MTEMRHTWPTPPAGEPGTYVPRWLFELIDAKALSVYVWLGINGVNLPPEKRTPEVLGVGMDGVLTRREMIEALDALRAVGGLDAENRVQLYPPARGE